MNIESIEALARLHSLWPQPGDKVPFGSSAAMRDAVRAFAIDLLSGQAPQLVPFEPKRWHELKTDPDTFDAVADGRKTCEIRLDDRDFMVGDGLVLRRTLHSGAQMREGAGLVYVGAPIRVIVTHVLVGYGITEGWCMLSIRPYGYTGDAADAAKWRALVSCGRIRPLGSAGLDRESTGDADYAHLGIDLWTKHPAFEHEADEREVAMRWLDGFITKALRIDASGADKHPPAGWAEKK